MDKIKVSLAKKKVVCPNAHLMWNKSRVAEERKKHVEFPGMFFTTKVRCGKCRLVYEVRLQYSNSYY